MVNNEGKQISEVFEYIQQFFGECQQLIYKLDSSIDEGWNSINGSRITTDISSSLNRPDNWIPEGIFRYYHNEDKEDVVKGITISFWKREDENIEEPILIGGSISYSDIKKHYYWDLWNLWFDTDDERVISNESINVYEIEDEESAIKSAKFFAYPLVWIKDDEALKTIIVDNLMRL